MSNSAVEWNERAVTWRVIIFLNFRSDRSLNIANIFFVKFCIWSAAPKSFSANKKTRQRVLSCLLSFAKFRKHHWRFIFVLLVVSYLFSYLCGRAVVTHVVLYGVLHHEMLLLKLLALLVWRRAWTHEVVVVVFVSMFWKIVCPMTSRSFSFKTYRCGPFSVCSISWRSTSLKMSTLLLSVGVDNHHTADSWRPYTTTQAL